MSRKSALIAEIPSGEDVLKALASLGAEGDLWVQATGTVEAVELRVAGDGDGPARVLDGQFTLISLLGPRGGPLMATLARSAPTGIEITGGVLSSARSAGVIAALVTAERLPTGPVDDERARAKPAAGSSMPAEWASAARASAARRANEFVEDERQPEAGDFVEHFAFGLCEVVTADGDRLRLRDQGPAPRIREVSTTMLRVMPPTESDGKVVFRLLRRT